LDAALWAEYAHRPQELSRVVASIRQAAVSGGQLHTAMAGEEEAVEGRLLFRLHCSRERSAALVSRKKAVTLRAEGVLRCEVCRFDFTAFYGALGEGYAECHHLTPLAEAGTEARTRLGDLAIVCANCHRMLHRPGSGGLPGLQRRIAAPAGAPHALQG
jgi:5-methylcytosine-specific restriction protein A